MAKQTKPTIVSANLHHQIKVTSAQSQIPIQDILDIFCQIGIFTINQAKEQGVKDENIADFLEHFMKNKRTVTHISLMAQNFQECLEAEEKK
jgi:hypothetical protein